MYFHCVWVENGKKEVTRKPQVQRITLLANYASKEALGACVGTYQSEGGTKSF